MTMNKENFVVSPQVANTSILARIHKQWKMRIHYFDNADWWKTQTVFFIFTERSENYLCFSSSPQSLFGGGYF